MFAFLTDIVRLAHLLFFAIGIGSAVFLESVFLSRARIRVELEELALIEKGHTLICIALTGLWATGLALIAIRTNFDPAAVTPKLMAKLAVVLLLTINAVIIAKLVNPLLNGIAYGQLSDLGKRDLCLVGGSVGLSAAGWLSALALGSIGLLKTLPGTTLAIIFCGILLAGLVAGTILAVLIPLSEPARETAIQRLKTKHAISPRTQGDETIDRVLKETIYANPIHRFSAQPAHSSLFDPDDRADRRKRT